MILEEIQIERFRSLKSVTWKPGRLNVLIGPNGGGKSNLLVSLYLLQAARDEGTLKKVILHMGGMAPLVWDGQSRGIRFEVKTTNTNSFYLWLRRIGATGGMDVSQPSDAESMAFLRYAEAWSIHRDIRTDQRSEIRRPAVTRHEKRVDGDGQNLIAVLHTLYVNDRAFEEF